MNTSETSERCKEYAKYFCVISLLAFEISKYTDSMSRWCYACPSTITPERLARMKREIDILLPFLGRNANDMGLVGADDPIYDEIRDIP